MSSIGDEKRRNLGRGLSALLGSSGAATVNAVIDGTAPVSGGERGRGGLRMLPVGQLKPGKYQPRRQFDEEAIADLVESVREKGILQPLLVRPFGDGYEIVAGERRWRAAQRAQLHEVPVIIRDLTDREALEIALVENLQRADLSTLEEAEGYRRLIDEFSHTQDELAKAVGKSRSHVANVMRLLALPDPIKGMLEDGQLTPGHARALLTAADPMAMARQVIDGGLNVRQTEKLVQDAGTAKPTRGRPPAHAKDADTAALERDLSEQLGVRVTLKSLGKGGELTIHYGSLDQLDDVLSRLTGEK